MDYNSGNEIERRRAALTAAGMVNHREGMIDVSDSTKSPLTFKFAPTVPLHPAMVNTPLWKDAPLAPVVLKGMIRPERGVWNHTAAWVVVRCPYCREVHDHGATGPDVTDPRQLLGGRIAHCTERPWSRHPIEYKLVEIVGRASREELDEFFPIVKRARNPRRDVWYSFDDIPRSQRGRRLVLVRHSIPRDLRAAVWNKSRGRCWYCGVHTNPFENFAVDHLVPVADGGTNDPANLVPACAKCNGSKGAMSLAAFRFKRGGGPFWFELEGIEP